MTTFNLDDYEMVKERKKRFYEKYPDGRIIPLHIELNCEHAIFQCFVYKNSEDQKNQLPLSSGTAQEFKGVGSFANKVSWCENCEESAVGRALDNAGFSSNNRCSKEEMIKVVRQKSSPNQKSETGTKAQNGAKPKEVKKALEGALPQQNSFGDYVIAGGKYKGTKVRDIDKVELKNYCEFLLKTFGRNAAAYQDLYTAIEKFYNLKLPDYNNVKLSTN